MQPVVSTGLWHLNSYGACLSAAPLAGSAVLVAELRRRSLPHVRSLGVLAVIACGAIIGARVDWILGHLGGAPSVELLLDGGFTFYGALILDCLVVLALASRYRITPLALCDA
jgi:prolipoprotein diacylglyceryltransferase